MNNEKNNNADLTSSGQTLSLENRKELRMSGVEDVDSFSETEIVIVTNMGRLTVKGENLHISKLNVDTGDFAADGHILSLVYSKHNGSKKGSFTQRLFK